MVQTSFEDFLERSSKFSSKKDDILDRVNQAKAKRAFWSSEEKNDVYGALLAWDATGMDFGSAEGLRKKLSGFENKPKKSRKNSFW